MILQLDTCLCDGLAKVLYKLNHYWESQDELPSCCVYGQSRNGPVMDLKVYGSRKKASRFLAKCNNRTERQASRTRPDK